MKKVTLNRFKKNKQKATTKKTDFIIKLVTTQFQAHINNALITILMTEAKRKQFSIPFDGIIKLLLQMQKGKTRGEKWKNCVCRGKK